MSEGPLAVTPYDVPRNALGSDLEGVLAIEGQCATVVKDFDAESATLLWPRGRTEWLPESETVVLDGLRYRSGDAVRVAISDSGEQLLEGVHPDCPAMQFVVIELDAS